MSKRSDRDFIRWYRSFVCFFFSVCLVYHVPLDTCYILFPDFLTDPYLTKEKLLIYLSDHSSDIELFIHEVLSCVHARSSESISDLPKDPG